MTVELTLKEREALRDLLEDWSILAKESGACGTDGDSLLATCLKDGHAFTAHEVEVLFAKLGIQEDQHG